MLRISDSHLVLFMRILVSLICYPMHLGGVVIIIFKVGCVSVSVFFHAAIVFRSLHAVPIYLDVLTVRLGRGELRLAGVLGATPGSLARLVRSFALLVGVKTDFTS